MDKFVIPGNPKDYYVSIRNESGVIEYSAMRGKIRQLAWDYSAYMNNIIARGDNPYTAQLDLSDQLDAFFSNEPLEAKIAFQNVYEQEISAESNKIADEANEILTKVEDAKVKQASFLNSCTQIGAVIIALLVVYFIFK